ncbi:MAG: type VI secretion system baseplate subunit TssG, partial [Acetobacteraceae bacterium]|nr:type VI secretion system baseplate subunit TssG [Acetobacteraceae bacterium]
MSSPPPAPSPPALSPPALSPPALSPLEALRRAAQTFDPMAALLVLERHGAAEAGSGRAAGGARVGEHAHPRDEAVRFTTSPRLGFQPSELVRLDEEAGRAPRLGVAFMGLAGAAGTLPQAYAELVLARLRDRDPTLAAFLDLFNHRAISLFMRAWEKYRLPLQLGLDRGDGIAGLIDALIGFGTAGQAGRIAGPHETLRFFAGFLGDVAHRPAAALEAMLSESLGEPVVIEVLVPRRERLAEEERTRLTSGAFTRLGDEALLGESVLRVDGSFRLRLGPMGYRRFRALMPDRPELPRLVALARL